MVFAVTSFGELVHNAAHFAGAMPGVDGVDSLVDGSAGIVRAPNMQDHFPETHSCDWQIVAGVEDPRDAFAEDLGIIFVGKVAKAFYFGLVRKSTRLNSSH